MEAKRKDPLTLRHRCARVEMSSNHSQDRGSDMQVTTYGVDLAKSVFQVHWVETDSGEVRRKMLTRGQLQAFFACRAPGVVAMEACGSAHHWGRTLKALGHQVRVISSQFVRPFVKSNKTDAADAQAIWEAAQRPEMRFVALKSEQQQALMGLHRIRAQLVKQRTMQANQVRGLLYEFGVVVPKSWRALLAQAAPILADASRGEIPDLIRGELQQQLQGLRDLTGRIEQLERSIGAYRAQDEQCRRIEAIPGVGPLSSTAIVASVGGCAHVSLGARVCRFPRARAASVRYGRTSEAFRHQQTRGPVPANPADPWGASGGEPQQSARTLDAALAARAPVAATEECGHCRAGQQDRAHDLGAISS